MNETQVYTVDIIFHNTINDVTDSLKAVVFAKTIEEIETLAKKECGEHYIGIRTIQLMEDFTPLMP